MVKGLKGNLLNLFFNSILRVIALSKRANDSSRFKKTRARQRWKWHKKKMRRKKRKRRYMRQRAK